MCGRFFLKMDDTFTSFKRLKMKCKDMQLPPFREGEVFPSQAILTLVMSDGICIPHVQKWGMVVDYHRMINARIETLSERKLFHPHLKRRCVIPASGFYEWMIVGDHKQKMRITFSCKPMYFAGIYNEQEEVVLITGEAQFEMADIHNRTPMILEENKILHYLHHQHHLIVNNQNLIIEPSLKESAFQQGSLF